MRLSFLYLRVIFFLAILSFFLVVFKLNERKGKLVSPNGLLEFYNSLINSEYKIYSQNGEDGVIEKLIETINLNKTHGYYVEFGVQDGQECNTRYLRVKFEWTGLLMDGLYRDPSINLHKENIHFNNILSLFEKYKVPIEIDVLSEDTDYADYYIIEKILTKYRPKILVHEVNQQPADMCVTVPREDDIILWDGTDFHGGSVCAFWCLAKRFSYTMVYCEKNGVNCFWIRNDLFEKHLGIDHKEAQKILDPKFLYQKQQFTHSSKNESNWVHVIC